MTSEDNVEAALRVHDALEEAFRHLGVRSARVCPIAGISANHLVRGTFKEFRPAQIGDDLVNSVFKREVRQLPQRYAGASFTFRERHPSYD